MTRYRHYINIAIYIAQVIPTILLLFVILTLGLEIPNIEYIINIIFIMALFIYLFKNKNVFTLLIGITLVIGNFSGLSAFGPTTLNSLHFNIGSVHIPLYCGVPIYSLLLLIYLICNRGFFIGVLTKEYWTDFLTRTHDLEAIYTVVNAKDPEKNDLEDDQNYGLPE